MKTTIGCLMLALLLPGASAETVRGLSTSLVTLEPRPDLQPSLNLKADELAILSLQKGARFFRAVVAEVVISESLRRYADSFAIALYSDLSPAPGRGDRVFEGRRILFHVLPLATRVLVRIPIVQAGGVAGDAGPETVLTAQVVDPERFPVLLVVQPIMKGIPDSILDRPFFVTLRAEILSRSLVSLKIVRPAGLEREPYRLRLDGKPVEAGTAPMEVEAGVHELEVDSEAFQKETASFAVSAGQTASLEIALLPAASWLSVDATAGAVVYLDGERIDVAPGQRRRLTEGTHTVRFKIGETNVSKSIEVRKGRHYHLSLALDVVIKEE